MVRNRRGLIAATAVVAILATACGGSSSGGSKAKGTPSGSSSSAKYAPLASGPITLCLSVALSGLTATQGQTAMYKVGTDYVNKNLHGIDGHEVKVELLNDSGNAQKTISNMEQMVSERKANANHCAAEIGMDYDPSLQPNMVAIANKAHMVTILDSSVDAYTDPSKYPYLFPISPSDARVGQAMGKFAADKKWNKWAVLTDNIPQETEEINDDLAGAKAAGGNPTIIKTVSIPPGAVNVSTALQQLKASNPDVLLVMIGFGYGAVWQGLNSMGWHPNLMGDLAAFYFGIDAMGPVAKTAYSPAWWGDIPNKPTLPANIKAIMDELAKYNPPHYPGKLISANVTLGKILLAKYAIEKYHSADSDAMKSALETLDNYQMFWEGMRWTYNSSKHIGPVGPYGAGAMRMDQLGPNDIFVYATPDGAPFPNPS